MKKGYQAIREASTELVLIVLKLCLRASVKDRNYKCLMTEFVMTKEEFEKGYAERSGLTLDELHTEGLSAEPCECDYEDCKGWQMRGKSSVEIA